MGVELETLGPRQDGRRAAEREAVARERGRNNPSINLILQNRRHIIPSTLCVLAGLLAPFRGPTPAKTEHSLPPVIRLDIDNDDNAVVPACRTITSYLNHAANPDARTSWQNWASDN